MARTFWQVKNSKGEFQGGAGKYNGDWTNEGRLFPDLKAVRKHLMELRRHLTARLKYIPGPTPVDVMEGWNVVQVEIVETGKRVGALDVLHNKDL